MSFPRLRYILSLASLLIWQSAHSQSCVQYAIGHHCGRPQLQLATPGIMTLLRDALTQQQKLHQPTDNRASQEEHYNCDRLPET